ncbi:putative leader peptide [Kitasatospora sp. NE20-6]
MQRAAGPSTDGTRTPLHGATGAYARRHIDLQRVASALCPR